MEAVILVFKRSLWLQCKDQITGGQDGKQETKEEMAPLV